MSESSLRVLVVDDERAIRRFLRVSLTAHGYTVYEASSGCEALQAVSSDRPDLIILDLGLPDMDGIEVTRQLREWNRTPIIVLSVHEEEATKVAALDAGADDYLTKPFGTAELMARMRAALRHVAQPASEPVFEVGELSMDLARRQVTFSGSEIALTPTEYDLLRVLVQHAGKVLTHRQLLRMVWGTGYEGEIHLLQVNISNLRRKIEPDPSRPSYILTEIGVGYRLRGE
ncbi:MAG: response regulator transcription factor [Anaerolineae bacterium]|nr:response regulator transcription factor [Anaerolineae bacterium]